MFQGRDAALEAAGLEGYAKDNVEIVRSLYATCGKTHPKIVNGASRRVLPNKRDSLLRRNATAT
jgi:hypothetical protein